MSKTRLAQNERVFMPHKWGKPASKKPLMRPWYGLDTERDAKTGEFVCAFACNDEARMNFRDLSELPSGTYWIYNLAYDIEGLIRDMDNENGWAMKVDGAPFVINGARCNYYHGKRFEWKDKYTNKVFLDLSPFFNRQPLKVIAKDFLDDGKDPVDASKMSLDRWLSDYEYRSLVNNYCAKDAWLVWKMADVLNGGMEGLGAVMKSTPGATARVFVSQLGDYPDIIWNTHKPFLKAYAGGRFELVKRGTFEGVSQYDITSAYPWGLRKCPWLTNSAYSRRATGFSDDALYGAYRLRVKTDEYLGPIPAFKGPTRVYGQSTRDAWVCRPEVEWMINQGYEVDIFDGVEIFDENATWAFSEIVDGLFQQKNNNKGQPKGHGAKVIINSLYGILIQIQQNRGHWEDVFKIADEGLTAVDFAGTLGLVPSEQPLKAGTQYAPVYAATLTSYVRALLLDTALETGHDNLIGMQTDSILTLKDNIKVGDGLGCWELEEKDQTLSVAKTGVYSIGEKVKSRGVLKASKEMIWQERLARKRRIGIKTAKSWSDVSLIVEEEVANNINADQKRIWERDLTKWDLIRGRNIDSKPIAYV